MRDDRKTQPKSDLAQTAVSSGPEPDQRIDNPKLARFLDRLDREMGQSRSPIAAE